MIETEFRFFEVQVEGACWNPIELRESALGIAPEGFDSVNVAVASGEFIGPMINSKVFFVADIDKAVIASPTIAVNDALKGNMASDNSLQCGFATVGYDLCENLPVSFENPKDDRFSTRPAPSLSSNSVRAKVGLVAFNFPLERRLSLAFLGHPLPDSKEDVIDGSHTHPYQKSSVSRSEIERKVPGEAPETRLRNFRTVIVLVLMSHGAGSMLSSLSFAS